MAFNDIYRLRVYQTLHAQSVINVMHFKEDIPMPTGTGAAALANEFLNTMGPYLRGRASNEMRFDYVEVQPLVPFGTATTAVAWPANTFGTVAGQCPSGMLAEVITLWTAQIGRRKRGRQYLAGLLGTRMNAGQTTSAQQTATTSLATQLAFRYCKVPYETSWALGVWSRVNGGAQPPYSSDGFTPVTSITVRTTLRTQRRRQLGVGV